MTAIKGTMKPTEWALLILLSILWGGSFFFIEVALRDIPPFTLVFLRVALAAAALYAIVRLSGGNLPTQLHAWRAFFGMALLNNVGPFCLLTWGQTQIASGLASILNATTPLWAVVVTHFLTFDEKATAAKGIGVGLGFMGVTLMFGSDAVAGMGGAAIAQAACLIATLCYALAGVFGHRFRTMAIPPLVAACGQLSAAAVILLPVAVLVDEPWWLATPGMTAWSAIAGLVLLSTAAAYFLYFRLLATVGATNLLLVTCLIPVTAIFLGSLVLGEVLQSKHFIGMVLIGSGLIAIDGRLARLVVNQGSGGGLSHRPSHYQGRDI